MLTITRINFAHAQIGYSDMRRQTTSRMKLNKRQLEKHSISICTIINIYVIIIIKIIIGVLSFLVHQKNNKRYYKPVFTDAGTCFVYTAILKFHVHPRVVEITQRG